MTVRALNQSDFGASLNHEINKGGGNEIISRAPGRDLFLCIRARAKRHAPFIPKGSRSLRRVQGGFGLSKTREEVMGLVPIISLRSPCFLILDLAYLAADYDALSPEFGKKMKTFPLELT